jgi:hypothetical protein
VSLGRSAPPQPGTTQIKAQTMVNHPEVIWFLPQTPGRPCQFAIETETPRQKKQAPLPRPAIAPHSQDGSYPCVVISASSTHPTDSDPQTNRVPLVRGQSEVAGLWRGESHSLRFLVPSLT